MKPTSLMFGRGYCNLDALIMAKIIFPHMHFSIKGDAINATLLSDDGYKLDVTQRDGILRIACPNEVSDRDIKRHNELLRRLHDYAGGVMTPKSANYNHVDTYFYKASANRRTFLSNTRDYYENFGAEAILDGILNAAKFGMSSSHLDHCGNDIILSDNHANHDVYVASSLSPHLSDVSSPRIMKRIESVFKDKGLNVSRVHLNQGDQNTSGVINVSLNGVSADVIVNVLSMDAALLDFCRRQPEVLDGRMVIATPSLDVSTGDARVDRKLAALHSRIDDALNESCIFKERCSAESFMLQARKGVEWDHVDSTIAPELAKRKSDTDFRVTDGVVIPKEDWKALCKDNGWKENAQAVKEVLNLAMTGPENVRAKLYPGLTEKQDVIAISSCRADTRQIGAAQYGYVCVGDTLSDVKVRTGDFVVSMSGVKGAVDDAKKALMIVFDNAMSIADYKADQERLRSQGARTAKQAPQIMQ